MKGEEYKEKQGKWIKKEGRVKIGKSEGLEKGEEKEEWEIMRDI